MLKPSCYLFVIGALALKAFAQIGTLPNGLAAGDVTETTAVLWTRSTTAGGSVSFEYSTDPTFSVIHGSISVPVLDPSVPVKASLSGLTPHTQYYYRANDQGGSSASGQFLTPSPSNARYGLRFGVSGDSLAGFSPFRALDNAPVRNLDFFVALGDTAYADYPTDTGGAAVTLGEFRAKHAEIYSDPRLMALRATTALLTVYDDHEVVDDFSGGASPASDPRFDNSGAYINETLLFNNGVQAFVEYNPIRDESYGTTGDPRTAGKRSFYRTQSYGLDAQLFMLDTRSFRDAPIPDPDLFTGIPGWRASTFDSSRTMLGQVQLTEFKQDLLQSQLDGTTWKFVMVPEPIQYLSPIGASDRFESYAAERSDILRFIDENDIENVVFITTDIHQMIVNDLSYRNGPNDPDIPLAAFELSTGPIGYEPGGVTVLTAAHDQGLLSDELFNAYTAMSLADKDAFFAQFLETTRTALPFLGYYSISPFGLEGSLINAQLLQGRWTLGHTLGWTEFDIDPLTQRLTVTTYGVDPGEGAPQLPQVFSQFVVTPVPEPTGLAILVLGAAAQGFALRRARVSRHRWTIRPAVVPTLPNGATQQQPPALSLSYRLTLTPPDRAAP